MKKTCIALYITAIITMAVITIVEKYQGTGFVSTHCYGAWWFSLLWAMLAAAAIFYIIQQRMRRWWLITLHASFVLILLGALLTHLTSQRGVVHLRTGVPTNNYTIWENGEIHERILPFTLTLNKFEMSLHPGTNAPADYTSQVTLIDGDKQSDFVVSMNNIHSYRGIRFYQMSYDRDGLGTTLTTNHDPYGIPVTYTGYALLFISLIYMLIDPRGTFRRLLRMLSVLALLQIALPGNAQTTLPPTTAAKIGELHILYNDRICPLQTYALDFTKKLYGKSHYGPYTAEQVLTGFIFWGDEWCNEPIVRIKGGDLKHTLDLPDYASVNSFFVPAMGGYILGPYVEQYYQGNHDGFHKQAAQIDDRLNLIMQLRRGAPLKVFPWTSRKQTVWLAPTDAMPSDMPADHQQYVANVFTLLLQEAQAGNFARMEEIVDKMLRYQQANAGTTLPSERVTAAERLYNMLPLATILFMVNLTLGFLSFFLYLLQQRRNSHYLLLQRAQQGVFILSWAALSFTLALRWVICSRVPMSNGYETMLVMAWFVMIVTLLLSARSTSRSSQLGTLVLSFGFLLSGFFLLVSHINQMDPQITHVMPVLNSPLLSIHVSIIMMAYALLSLTFICALVGLLLRREAEQLAVLSRVFLYPALTTLGLGIFIGAVWANMSWGTYWSWDPKETWALITLMTYAAVVHTQSLPLFRKPLVYHAYMLAAFLTLLMTYFGVNYFLGGMHSYA
ncbi:MAG: cytochrome c biogenesis protein CcsA [Prevotella sp.]|nr:cytochrome c biogenesis protein CcsA [Prevotella sp.]